MPLMGRRGRPGLIGLAARTAVVAGTASAVTGRAARNQELRAESEQERQQFEAQQQQSQMQAAANQAVAQAAAAPALTPPPGGDLVAQLQQLATLQAQGVLSSDEFAAAKAKLLS
ncbi:MAG TPA: SHOCT domain-containing protein [Leifsonia sp.]|nr:SHOCT domain-containing protein [Leifsonia sp.]